MRIRTTLALFGVVLLLTAFTFINTNTPPQNDPCSGTKYYDLEKALKEPGKVKVLDIAMQRPKLKTIPAEIGKLVNLECLDASYNQISSLPEEMKELKKLKVLNLAGNRYLSKLPDVIKEIPNLEVLDLSDIPEWNKEKCDAAKAALPNVKVITDK